MVHPSRFLGAVSPALFCIGLVACGGAEPAGEAGPAADVPPGMEAYAAECTKMRGEHDSAVATGRYLPPDLFIHDWPAPATKGPAKAAGSAPAADAAAPAAPHKVLAEHAFLDALRAGESKSTLLIARGGTGKSRLAESMKAQLCGEMPVFRVDLHWDVDAHRDEWTEGRNPILEEVGKQLGTVSAGGAAFKDWQRKTVDTLADRRWLLLLDALDEVALENRDSVVAHVDALLDAYPQLMTVVFTRPPVYSGNYGLRHLDGRVEIPPLTCERVDTIVAAAIPDIEKRRRFDELVHRFGLDRKVEVAGRCSYPHMSTFRDFHVVRKLAENIDPNVMPNELHASRASIYERFISALLIKDLQEVAVEHKLMPRQALGIVDKMVAAADPKAGDRKLGFTIGNCLAHMPIEDEEARGKGCEKLLQSSLFKRTTDPAAKTWQFNNQSIGDFFLARHTDALMAERPTLPCAVVRERGQMFESNEIAGFLVGLPKGSQCLLDVTRELCSRGGFAEHNFEQLDHGLPTTDARYSLLTTAYARLSAVPDAGLCAPKLLDRLTETLPEKLRAKPPSEAAREATADKAKDAPAEPTKKATRKRSKRSKRSKRRRRR
jgi:hypothetical protein